MLLNYTNLLNRDPELIFKKKNNIESHINRNLNIEASSNQHEKYFNRILKIIEKIYTKRDKPSYIMDVGCGDGLLLKKIYLHLNKILDRKSLKKITLIGIDLNQISINAAKKNLSRMKAIFVRESIDNPENIFKFLKKKNVNTEQILQVRSFVDHERFVSHNQRESTVKDKFINRLDSDVSGISKYGEYIASAKINQSLDLYYKKWFNFISRFGLINLEVHKQNLNEMKKNLDLNEGAHFDFIQVLSRQNLCKPKVQIYCMIKNALAPEIIETYPTNTNFIRIILGYYKKKRLNSNFQKKTYQRAIKFL